MDSAMGRISSGRESGTPATQSTNSFRGIWQTCASPIPLSLGALAASESLLPPHSGQISSFKNFSTRFMPFSSFTFARAFSTVYTALKYVKSSSPA